MSFISRLRVKFGIIPNTEKIETSLSTVASEYANLVTYQSSAELAEFEELSSFCNSNEFLVKKRDIEAQKFANTDEFQKFKEYQTLKSSSLIKNYFKVKGSKALQDFQMFEKSSELKELNSLEKFVNSDEFIEAKANTPAKEFKTSDAHQKEIRYQQLKKSSPVKKYFAFQNAMQYKQFQETENSADLLRLQELENFVLSADFIKVKEYMALSPKKKFELSDEYKKLQRYLELKKSNKIKWYFKTKDSKKFDEIKKWKLTFVEDFKEKLNPNVWINKFFYGEITQQGGYSIFSDKVFMTEGNNLDVSNSKLRITTRKEKKEGKAWHPKYGFHSKSFDYTSGVVNTGSSFRQKFGKIEARVRMDNSSATNAIWLNGENASPQINLFNHHNGHLSVGHLWGNLNPKESKKEIAKFSGSKYAADYHIITLEWYNDKLVWKVNGLEASTQINEIPQEAMYITICATILDKHINEAKLPSLMEVDWIKVYELS